MTPDVQVPLVGRLLRSAWFLAPTVALLLARALGDGGARGVYQGAVAALAVACATGAFVCLPRRRLGTGLLAQAAAAAAAHLVLGGPLQAALAFAALVGAVSIASAGLGALGRGVGAPRVPAGAVAAAVVWAASLGLFWADPLAGRVHPGRRHALRQAVLFVDPSLAAAYDVASYDRLRAADVYFDVPVASSLVEVPRAAPTALVWLVTGLVGGGLAALAGRGKVGGGGARRGGRCGEGGRETP